MLSLDDWKLKKSKATIGQPQHKLWSVVSCRRPKAMHDNLMHTRRVTCLQETHLLLYNFAAPISKMLLLTFFLIFPIGAHVSMRFRVLSVAAPGRE